MFYLPKNLEHDHSLARSGSDGVFDLYKLPLLFGLLSLAIQLPFSIAKDVRRRKALRYGRRLKGPEMMTPREFNDRVAGDGIGIKTNEMKTMIRIPQRAEAQHMQIIGDMRSTSASCIC